MSSFMIKQISASKCVWSFFRPAISRLRLKRGDLWEVYPESKKAFFKPYQKSALKRFKKNYAREKSILLHSRQ